MIEFLLLMFMSVLFLLFSMYVKTNNKLLAFLYIITIAAFAANRSLMIQDTQGYLDFFKNVSMDFSHVKNETYFETGYILLSITIKFLFGSSYKVFFFINSVIIMSLLTLGIHFFSENSDDAKNEAALNRKKEIKYTIPLVLYFMTFGYVFNFITLRIGIAFSLVFLAISLFEKHKILSILLYILGAFFHLSTIFMIVSLPFLLSKNKYKKDFFYGWIIMIIPLSILGYSNVIIRSFFFIIGKIPFLASRFHPFITESVIVDQKAIFLRLFILLIIGFLAVNSQETKQRNYILKTYLLGLTVFALFINLSVISRIVEIFLGMIFILLFYFFRVKKSKIYYRIALVLCLVYFIISNLRLISK